MTNIGHGRIADDDFGAQPQSLHKAAGDQLRHVLGKGCGERGQAKDQQVDLVGEAASELVADKACDQRADRHADKGQRDELEILRQRREFRLDQRGQYAARDIEIVAVEEHPGADEREDAVVKRRYRQPV
jgi:hypothetical protein